MSSPAVLIPSSLGFWLIPWPAAEIELFQSTNAWQTLLAQSSAGVAALELPVSPVAPVLLLLPPPQPAAMTATARIRTARRVRMSRMLPG
jgi:hypothetical protein